MKDRDQVARLHTFGAEPKPILTGMENPSMATLPQHNGVEVLTIFFGSMGVFHGIGTFG